MNPLQRLFYGVRLVGLPNAWRALRYTWRKHLRDRQPPPLPQPALPAPGETPQRLEAHEGGVHVHFASCILTVEVLDEDAFLLTWHPGPDLPPYGRAESSWPGGRFALHTEAGTNAGVLETNRVRLHITSEGLEWRTPEGVLWRAEPWPALLPGGAGWEHAVPLPDQAAVYGLGPRLQSLNLRPGRYTLWNRDPGGTYGPGQDPLNLNLPVVWVVQTEAPPYAWVYENPAPGRVAVDAALTFRWEGGPARSVLFFGSPERVAHLLARYTGFPPLPPRWALGYHQSRWGYRSQAEVEALLENFRLHDLPLDALHLDIDYMDRHRVFTVDTRRFPRLSQLAQRAREQGVHLVTIVDPGLPVDEGHAPYREARDWRGLCVDARGEEVHAPVWPGWCAFPDFTREDVRTWWGDQYRRLLEQGIRGFWHDMNEPSAFVALGDPTLPLDTQHHGDGHPGSHRLYHQVYGLLMNRAGFEGLRRLQPQRRPWILSRSGWLGVQRYAWNWTGDIESSWEALRHVPAQTLNLSLAGQPYNGPDVGGFSGNPDPELYLRWLQTAAWLPFFRTHSAKTTARREPWHFDEPYFRLIRATLKMRRTWRPYWYTLAWQAAQQGLPLVRPLWWLAPDMPELWDVDDAFLVGDAVLVAPVLEPGQRHKDVFLPPGRWRDLETLADHAGPCRITVSAPLGRLPLFLRAGYLVPVEERPHTLTWLLAPPKIGQALHGVGYFDAGDGYGPWLVLLWKGQRTSRGMELQLEARGTFAFPYRHHRLRVLGPHVQEYDLPAPTTFAPLTLSLPVPEPTSP